MNDKTEYNVQWDKEARKVAGRALGSESDSMQLLDGKITISRVQSNTEDDYIFLEIVYGQRRIRGKMCMKDYANCISGLARQQILISAI